MSWSDFQSSWVSHCLLSRVLHWLGPSFHTSVPHIANLLVSSHAVPQTLRGCQPVLVFSTLYTFPESYQQVSWLELPSLFPFILSWSLSGSPQGPGVSVEKSTIPQWETGSESPVSKPALLFKPHFLLLRWWWCVCWLAGLRALLPSKLTWWPQISDLPSAYWQSNLSPLQISGSTYFFKGFISQKPLLARMNKTWS